MRNIYACHHAVVYVFELPLAEQNGFGRMALVLLRSSENSVDGGDADVASSDKPNGSRETKHEILINKYTV